VIRALLRKELRQLLPLIVGLGALQVWSLIDQFILKSPDTYNWAVWSWLTSTDVAKWVAYTELAVGIFIAYGLLPGEHDQRTIEFLYTLPVRRRTLFLVKYATGVGVAAALSLSGTLQMVARHALHPGAFERAFLRPTPILLTLAGDLALPFVFVAYGMLLSFFRRLGWVLIMLVGLALELAERIHPSLRVLSVRALFEVEHHGTEPLINWRAWQVHGVMAAVALLLAARLWLEREEGFAAFRHRLRTGGRALRVGVGLAAAAVVVAAIAVVGPKLGSSVPQTKAADDRVLAFETDRFHFTYASSRTPQAMIVVRAADQAYARVRRWLGAPEVELIVADLTDESNEHTGIAGWKKMRLDIRPPKPDALLVHVLYHETTHVFTAALSEGAPDQRQAALRFFWEGLAEYVAYDLLADRGVERDQSRHIAALAKSRFHLRFEDLLTPKAFIERHDEYLLYALGEVWVAALVETCGQGAPARALRRFGGAGVPQTLAGLDLWRQSLQLDGCDLDRVVGAFERRLRRLERDATAVLPIAAGKFVEREDDSLSFEVAVKSATTQGPFQVTVRVRSNADALPAEVRSRTILLPAGLPERIFVAAPRDLGKRLEFQVGASALPDGRPFFTRWESTTLIE
jgi:hypothetical protein